jgi:hypothetical protein
MVCRFLEAQSGRHLELFVPLLPDGRISAFPHSGILKFMVPRHPQSFVCLSLCPLGGGWVGPTSLTFSPPVPIIYYKGSSVPLILIFLCMCIAATAPDSCHQFLPNWVSMQRFSCALSFWFTLHQLPSPASCMCLFPFPSKHPSLCRPDCISSVLLSHKLCMARPRPYSPLACARARCPCRRPNQWKHRCFVNTMSIPDA